MSIKFWEIPEIVSVREFPLVEAGANNSPRNSWSKQISAKLPEMPASVIKRTLPWTFYWEVSNKFLGSYFFDTLMYRCLQKKTKRAIFLQDQWKLQDGRIRNHRVISTGSKVMLMPDN